MSDILDAPPEPEGDDQAARADTLSDDELKALEEDQAYADIEEEDEPDEEEGA